MSQRMTLDLLVADLCGPDDDVHVFPTYGRPHEADERCWCGPEVEYVAANTGARVWLHRDLN